MLTRSYAGSIGKTKKTLQSDLPMLVTPFELWNCGSNVPQVEEGAAIVAQQFDMRPNPTTGVISGATYRLDQILCGNVNSTEWVVTEYKASNNRETPVVPLHAQPAKVAAQNHFSFCRHCDVCRLTCDPPSHDEIILATQILRLNDQE
jgi:hypothetical protein